MQIIYENCNHHQQDVFDALCAIVGFGNLQRHGVFKSAGVLTNHELQVFGL